MSVRCSVSNKCSGLLLVFILLNGESVVCCRWRCVVDITYPEEQEKQGEIGVSVSVYFKIL